MLCVVVIVFTLTGLCGGDSDNSLPLPLLPPPPTVSQRMSQAHVASLRRQLMRDNYDYQHSDDGRSQPNVTERSDDDAPKFYNPQGGADHLQRASELDQANVNSFSAELDQQDQYEQQDRQHQQGGKHDQPVKYEQRRQRRPGHPHEQLNNNENRGQNEEHEQPDQYDQQESRKQQHQLQQRGQNERLRKYRDPNKQPVEHEQRGQYEQRRQLEQPGKHKHRYQYKRAGKRRQLGQLDHDQYKQFYQYEQREQRSSQGDQPEQHMHRRQLEQRSQLEHRNQDVERSPHGQRGQNTKNDQRVQLDQFDEQEPSMERTDRAVPPLADAPPAPSDVLTVHERDYPPARHAAHPDWPVQYYNKRRDTYDPEPMQRRPLGDLRSNYKEPFSRDDATNDQRGQEKQALGKDAQSPEQELSPDEREAFDRQEVSGSENERSDISESQKQPDARSDEFRPLSRQYSRVTRSTRANRLLYYTPPPTRRIPPPRVIPLTYHDDDPPPQYDHNVPQEPQQNAPRYFHRDIPPSRHRNAPRDHNISKKDLLYYMDDTHLRRRNNHMSPDVPDDDQSTGDEPLSLQSTTGSLHSTTGINPKSAGSRHSTDSARPSPVGTPASPVTPRAGPIDRRVNPAGSQASLTGSRLSPVGSRASPASTHSKPSRHPGTTRSPDLPRTERARSFVVTVSPNNVTYKLLTLKSREGRRRVEQRLLEERGPGGVAIISLDHAPLPAFRLPRARRQYMHAHRHRRHKPTKINTSYHTTPNTRHS